MRCVRWWPHLKLLLLAMATGAILAACAAPTATPAPKPTEAPKHAAEAAKPAAPAAPVAQPPTAAPAAPAAPNPTAAPKPTEAPRPAAPAAAKATDVPKPAATAAPAATIVAPASAPDPAGGSMPSVGGGAGPALDITADASTAKLLVGTITPPAVPMVASAPANAPTASSEPPANLNVTAPAPTTQLPLPPTVAIIEPRVVEVEYPSHMQLGNSEVIRLSLVPSAEGYTLTLDSPNNTVITRSVNVKHPLNTLVNAEAKLTGINFDIAEHDPQPHPLTEGEATRWQWTIRPHEAGQHKLTISVDLIWIFDNGAGASKRSQLFSKGIEIQVQSVLGLSEWQGNLLGSIGLVLGGGLMTLAVLSWRKRAAPKIALVSQPGMAGKMQPAPATDSPLIHAPPNLDLRIEKSAGIELQAHETALMQALFGAYERIMIEREFRSGYSGARTLLVLPIRNDGRADAYTIAKMGESNAIAQEYLNFERYVKHTLPPITARIQEAPVVSQEPRAKNQEARAKNQEARAKSQEARIKSQEPSPQLSTLNSQLSTPPPPQAVLRYTFIGEQGKIPMSLGDALRQDGEAELLRKLINTFGPNWWFQRRPYSFRLGQEYDRVLPAHLVVAPAQPNDTPNHIIDGQATPSAAEVAIGSCVLLRNFGQMELGASDNRYALIGTAAAGQAPLRVRCANWTDGRHKPDAACTSRGLLARVIGSRESLLRDAAAGLPLFGLPDPLPLLPRLLNERVSGSQSTIHGDLNLENALVGPGGFIWLIDFATTRDGHTLFDFAHLHAEIIAHIIAPDTPIHRDFDSPLLNELRNLAQHCWFNPTQNREYDLALFVSCLGALKYRNLDRHQRHWLYLSAAKIGQTL